ncbi:hypothetical protein EYR38_005006 [Pleurotus pulmonarius]|nr:hypothetical protein EYR38_005006 [Pleurotus pulmonarius]
MPVGNAADAVLQIFSKSGYVELVMLRATCKLFYTILNDKPEYWKRTRLAFRPSLPPLPEDGTSEQQYASQVFGGGPCVVCRRWSYTIPLIFALRLYLCLSRDCFMQHKLEIRRITTHLRPKPGLPRDEAVGLSRKLQKWLAFAEADRKLSFKCRRFILQHIVDAEEAYIEAKANNSLQQLYSVWERRQRARIPFMKTCVALQQWSTVFTAKMTKNAKRIMNTLRQISASESIPLSSIMRTLAFRKHYEILLLSNRAISINDWRSMRSAVHDNIRKARAVKNFTDTPTNPSELLRCGHCVYNYHAVHSMNSLKTHLHVEHGARKAVDVVDEPMVPSTRCLDEDL